MRSVSLGDVLQSAATAARLEQLVRLARRVRSRRRGAFKLPGRGVEVGGRRDYVPGDDLRLVDWPAYARLERMLLKVTEEQPEPRLDLVLDGSASMQVGEPSPLLRAALACAALAAVSTARDVRVVLWWGGAPLAQQALRRPSELPRLLRFMSGLRGVGAGDLRGAALLAAQRIRHAGAALVLSDGLDERVGDAARRLRSRGCDTRVVLIEPRHELEELAQAAFAEGGLAELVDAETGARVLRPLGPVALAEARRARESRLRAEQARLEEQGTPALRLPAADPFEAIARTLLRA